MTTSRGTIYIYSPILNQFWDTQWQAYKEEKTWVADMEALATVNYILGDERANGRY